MRIGFFDSGVGGITVLREAIRLLPHEDYLYYADVNNVPYGTKNKELVRSFIFDAGEFIIRQGVKALVIACNTATSVAIADLRKEFSLPILGMEPAVKPAIERNKNKRVLVAATPVTLMEQKYQSLVERLDHDHVVDAIPLPELVDYAERFIFDEDSIISYLSERLMPYDPERYGTVVLGCTHFPFYRKQFKKIFPIGTDIIDGSIGTVRYLKKMLEAKELTDNNGSGDVIFYSSGKEESVDSRYRKYLELLDSVNYGE